MLSIKPLCSVFRGFYFRLSVISIGTLREYSSKKSGNRKKNNEKITVIAKNDFVTHQLNSSISTHLKRQQKIWNRQQEEEREWFYKNRRRNYDFDTSDGFQKTQKKSPKKEYNRRKSYDYDAKSNSKTCKNEKQLSRSYNDKHIFDKNGKNHNKSVNENLAAANKACALINSRLSANENDFSDNDSDDYAIDELDMPNWEDMNLVGSNKNFYKPSAETENRSAGDIHEFHAKSYIKSDANVPKPIFKFDELKEFSSKMIAEVERQGFSECTPIQSQGIPLTLSGSNAIAISRTGTGKTLAMVLSALIHISYQSPRRSENGPIAVILALSQEIADQIQQAASRLCNEANITCTVLCNNPRQSKSHVKQMEVGELLITTPCHLYEILRTKSLNLERCSHFALYEADKMVEMCFDEEIIQIDSQIRPDCQRVFWSTSWSSELGTIAIDDCIRLDVGTSLVKANISPHINQIVKFSDEKNKKSVLLEIADNIALKKDRQKTLLFTGTPKIADEIAELLQKESYQSKSFHNGKSLIQRNTILSEFENDEFQFLVLTDLAAKNIDFSKIFNMINVDMPNCISDYVHRVNRTGRIDDGTAYSIVTEEDGDLADDLITILQQTNQTVAPALFILKAANVDSDDEISFAVPEGKGFRKYTIDNNNRK